jgi:hypothetical protein
MLPYIAYMDPMGMTITKHVSPRGRNCFAGPFLSFPKLEPFASELEL